MPSRFYRVWLREDILYPVEVQAKNKKQALAYAKGLIENNEVPTENGTPSGFSVVDTEQVDASDARGFDDISNL